MSDTDKYTRIGILGGTFDPIHFGHLLCAENMRQKLGLERVYFVPTGAQPFKNPGDSADSSHRLNMVNLAIADNPAFCADSCDIDRAGTTYTVDTIREFNIRYPNAEIFFIIGADQLERLNCWKDIEVLSKICIFVCANRPGVEGVLIEENLAKLRDSTGLRIRYIEMPPWDVSSTRIREGIRFGRGARYLVPEAVADYVARHGLYRGEYDFAGILERLERDLPGWLYAHSLGTMEIAVKMGEHYEADGATLEKIRLAALLHDCGKPDSGKMTFQKLAEKCSPTYQLSDFFAGKPEMYHCYLSSIYAREKFGISEFDILSAIASHTFATKNMSFTDKIIFVADMLDEGRPSEDGCENIRTLAFQDLNKAVIAAIQYHINKHTIAGNKIFPPSYEVLEYLIEEQKNG